MDPATKDLIKALVAGLLRHASTAIAGYLFSQSLITQSETEQVAGAITLFGGIAWSAWQKWGVSLVKHEMEMLRAKLALRQQAKP